MGYGGTVLFIALLYICICMGKGHLVIHFDTIWFDGDLGFLSPLLATLAPCGGRNAILLFFLREQRALPHRFKRWDN